MNFGIIGKSESNTLNPIVVVMKKDKSIRFCLDARALNKMDINQSIDSLQKQVYDL